MHSDPHPTHQFCPPVNDVGMLSNGQNGETATFDRAGTCTYHDHLDPDNASFRGSIVVGDTPDPGPNPDPAPYGR